LFLEAQYTYSQYPTIDFLTSSSIQDIQSNYTISDIIVESTDTSLLEDIGEIKLGNEIYTYTPLADGYDLLKATISDTQDNEVIHTAFIYIRNNSILNEKLFIIRDVINIPYKVGTGFTSDVIQPEINDTFTTSIDYPEQSKKIKMIGHIHIQSSGVNSSFNSTIDTFNSYGNNTPFTIKNQENKLALEIKISRSNLSDKETPTYILFVVYDEFGNLYDSFMVKINMIHDDWEVGRFVYDDFIGLYKDNKTDQFIESIPSPPPKIYDTMLYTMQINEPINLNNILTITQQNYDTTKYKINIEKIDLISRSDLYNSLKNDTLLNDLRTEHNFTLIELFTFDQSTYDTIDEYKNLKNAGYSVKDFKDLYDSDINTLLKEQNATITKFIDFLIDNVEFIVQDFGKGLGLTSKDYIESKRITYSNLKQKSYALTDFYNDGLITDKNNIIQIIDLLQGGYRIKDLKEFNVNSQQFYDDTTLILITINGQRVLTNQYKEAGYTIIQLRSTEDEELVNNTNFTTRHFTGEAFKGAGYTAFDFIEAIQIRKQENNTILYTLQDLVNFGFNINEIKQADEAFVSNNNIEISTLLYGNNDYFSDSLIRNSFPITIQELKTAGFKIFDYPINNQRFTGQLLKEAGYTAFDFIEAIQIRKQEDNTILYTLQDLVNSGFKINEIKQADEEFVIQSQQEGQEGQEKLYSNTVLLSLRKRNNFDIEIIEFSNADFTPLEMYNSDPDFFSIEKIATSGIYTFLQLYNLDNTIFSFNVLANYFSINYNELINANQALETIITIVELIKIEKNNVELISNEIVIPLKQEENIYIVKNIQNDGSLNIEILNNTEELNDISKIEITFEKDDSIDSIDNIQYILKITGKENIKDLIGKKDELILKISRQLEGEIDSIELQIILNFFLLTEWKQNIDTNINIPSNTIFEFNFIENLIFSNINNIILDVSFVNCDANEQEPSDLIDVVINQNDGSIRVIPKSLFTQGNVKMIIYINDGGTIVEPLEIDIEISQAIFNSRVIIDKRIILNPNSLKRINFIIEPLYFNYKDFELSYNEINDETNESEGSGSINTQTISEYINSISIENNSLEIETTNYTITNNKKLIITLTMKEDNNSTPLQIIEFELILLFFTELPIVLRRNVIESNIIKKNIITNKIPVSTFKNEKIEKIEK
jgi:hypothetical protein